MIVSDTARFRAVVALATLSACADTYPGEQLPDDGGFTSSNFGTTTTASTGTTTQGSTSTSASTMESGDDTTSGTSTTTSTLSETGTGEGSSETGIDTDDGSTGGSGESTTTDVSTTTTGPMTTTTSAGESSSTTAEGSSSGGADTLEGGEESSSGGVIGEDPVCGNGTPETGEVCFDVPTSFALGGNVNPVDIVAGDFDGDTEPDLATANADGSLTVLLGNGDGTFADDGDAVQIPIADLNPVRLQAAQLDGQNGLDLVVLDAGNGTAPGRFLVLLADGSGGVFADPVPYEVGVSPTDLTLGAIAPEPIDVAVANGAENAVYVALNDGMGAFGTPVVSMTAVNAMPFAPNAVAFGSFGGSGAIDLLSAGGGQWVAMAGNGTAVFGNANGQIPGNNGLASNLRRANHGNLDGDGFNDVVLVDDEQTVVLHRNAEPATFENPTFLPLSAPAEAIFGNVAGDGSIDVVAASSDDAIVAVYLGNGAGDFTETADTVVGTNPIDVAANPTGVAVIDLNGDGVMDILVSHDDGAADSVSVLLSAP